MLLAAGADGNAAVLQEAAKNGHQGIVEKLLEAEADINTASSDRQTALQAAVNNGH